MKNEGSPQRRGRIFHTKRASFALFRPLHFFSVKPLKLGHPSSRSYTTDIQSLATKIWRDAPAVAPTRWIWRAQSCVVVAALRLLLRIPQITSQPLSRTAHRARRGRSVELVTSASLARQNAVVISRAPSAWLRGGIACITRNTREDVPRLLHRALWLLHLSLLLLRAVSYLVRTVIVKPGP